MHRQALASKCHLLVVFDFFLLIFFFLSFLEKIKFSEVASSKVKSLKSAVLLTLMLNVFLD